MEPIEEATVHQLPHSVSDKTPQTFGVHDTLRHGFASARKDAIPSHPLEQAQANFAVSRESAMLQALRDTQGLHASLQLQMERKLVSRVQRIPPLESSMVMLDALTGNDECLGIEEVLNPPSESPLTVDTHATMERKLKMN